jgi:PAS domain S-box-containing protein
MVFDKFMRERALWLRSQCWVVAEDPRFTATLDIQDPDLEYQARTVLREAQRFQGIIGSDLFIVTNRSGRTLARIDVSTSDDGDLSGMPTMATAFGGAPATGSWRLGEFVYHVATVPVQEANRVIGTLSVGFLEAVDTRAMSRSALIAAAAENLRPALGAGDRKRATTLIQDIQRDFASDLVALTDRTGLVWVLRVASVHYGEDLSGMPQIRDALNGTDTGGLQVNRGRMVQMSVVPVWSHDGVIGTLSAGFEIDDRLARDLRDMTHTEVSFVLNGRVMASTWPEAARRVLEQRLFAGNTPHRTWATPSTMPIGSETYLSLAGELNAGKDTEHGVYLIQLSLDQATGFLTTIDRALLLIGGSVLTAVVLISSLGVARLVKPVRALVEGTRRLAAGRLEYRIPATSWDEIGELAASFNDMAEALTRSRSALTESEARYRDLFDNAHDMVYTTDLDMRITSINKAGLDLSGYTLEELLGRSFYDLMSPEDGARLRTPEPLAPPGGPWPSFEVEIRRKDGKTATLEVASRWILEGGKPVGMHGIGRDITDRRERERATNRFREQLFQTEKLRALGEMAAGVAHNFNNLLTGVLGYAQLIEMRDDVSGSIRKSARQIVEAARRCATVVRRIQTFGRPIDITNLKPIDLHQVIRDTVELTRPKWKMVSEREGRTIRLQLALDPIPPVESVGAIWEEILVNLIFNAVDAMPHGGTITIKTRTEGDQVAVALSDTGIGMDEETQRRIFEPFFTTKAPELGTGLGLSTVWGLVQSQHGQIKVDSAPGQGTTFTIRVPVAAGAALPVEEQGGARITRRLRILVIDDEPSARDILPRMLAEHTVDTAARGEEGWERFLRNPYDMVISDWSMPGMSGLDIALEVKRQSPATVMVLMTGWDVRGTAADYSPAIDLILSKPIEVDQVKWVVAQAIQLREKGTVSSE